jgi:hypothetical protein
MGRNPGLQSYLQGKVAQGDEDLPEGNARGIALVQLPITSFFHTDDLLEYMGEKARLTILLLASRRLLFTKSYSILTTQCCDIIYKAQNKIS